MANKNNNLTYVPASARKGQSNSSLLATKKASIKKQKTLVISMISLVTVIVLVVSLCIGLYQAPSRTEITNTNLETPATKDEAAIKNGNFGYAVDDKFNSAGEIVNYNKRSYPLAPYNWRVSTNNNTNCLVGLIDTSEANWPKVKTNIVGNYGLTDAEAALLPANANDLKNTNVENTDNRVLMVYNRTAEDISSAVSKNFSVSAGNYVTLTVWVKTANIASGTGAYIGLKQNQTSTEYKVLFEDITATEWTKYTVVVEGGSSSTLYLEVGLGRAKDDGTKEAAKGIAYFDSSLIEVDQTKADYIAAKTETATQKAISLTTEKKDESLDAPFTTTGADSVTQDQFKNITGATKIPFESTSNDIQKLSVTANPYNTDNKNTKAITFKYTNQLQSPSLNAYKISFWVYTNDLDHNKGAYIYVNYKAAATNSSPAVDKTEVAFSAINTNLQDKNKTTNGWAQYEIYIQAEDSRNYDVSIECFLGKKINDNNETFTKGNLFINEIVAKKITNLQYSQASATNIKKIALSSATTATNLVNNGDFNTIDANAAIGTYPYTPVNWDLEIQKNANGGYAPNDKISFGAINANKNQTGLEGNINTAFGDNALLLRADTNSGKTAFGAKSADIALAADSKYMFSVWVKTSANNMANVYLKSKDGLIDCSVKANKVTSEQYYPTVVKDFNGYTQIVFVVETGYTARTINIELWLGEANTADTNWASAGDWAIFDKIHGEAIETKAYDKMIADKEFTVDATDNKTITSTKYTNIVGTSLVKSDVKPEDPTEDDTEEKEPEVKPTYEPIDWLLLTSVIVSAAMLVAVVIILVRRMKVFKKTNEKPESKYKK